MLKIRLSRTGKKRQPSYRVVVADSRSKRDGRIVERIGHYNPLKDPIEFLVKEERALHWLSVGAQPTDAVKRLLDKQGTYDRLKRLHAGEQLEALVAEYKGEPWPPEVEEEEEETSVVEAAVETVTDAAEAVAEVVETAVAGAVGVVAEVVSGDEEE